MVPDQSRYSINRLIANLIVLGSGSLGLLGRGGSSLLGLLGEKHRVDVGEHTSLRDGDTAQKLVQLLVVADSKLDVTGNDAGLLVVAGGVTGKLKDLSSQVLKDGSQVHGGTGTDTGSVLASLEVSANSGNGELKSSLGARRLFLAGRGTSSSLWCSSHFDKFLNLLQIVTSDSE